jgi:DNA-binding Lrp family transcriptional regulator
MPERSEQRTPRHDFLGIDLRTIPLDEIDKGILEALVRNSRTSNIEIARMVGVNESTVRRRIESLENRGIIRGFTVQLGTTKSRTGVRAHIFLKVDTSAIDEIVQALCESENTLSVHRIVGQYDIVTEVVFDTMGELHSFYDGFFKRSTVQDLMAYIVVNCFKTPLLPIS